MGKLVKDKEDEKLEIPSFLRNADDHDKEDKSLPYYCSFCGKSQDEVRKMIEGAVPNVCICHECVDLCVEIIKEENKMEKTKKS